MAFYDVVGTDYKVVGALEQSGSYLKIQSKSDQRLSRAHLQHEKQRLNGHISYTTNA
jgi:hypothetical protein